MGDGEWGDDERGMLTYRTRDGEFGAVVVSLMAELERKQGAIRVPEMKVAVSVGSVYGCCVCGWRCRVEERRRPGARCQDQQVATANQTSGVLLSFPSHLHIHGRHASGPSVLPPFKPSSVTLSRSHPRLSSPCITCCDSRVAACAQPPGIDTDDISVNQRCLGRSA
ncbi:hypothetical protein K402DRAFT_106411 [Aulographum hederae CBS 113979]|uniref:Uncharacterized protein n=1 Tax=Aulographum hederae CBS 113979 TaxID=1176131 RepID=A0A6G1GXL6_9PEZI|nr:hypothetical protein K402DRAFT_106411 [Aulographum hederae CBS 113979]